jgi:hypothetical protein
VPRPRRPLAAERLRRLRPAANPRRLLGLARPTPLRLAARAAERAQVAKAPAHQAPKAAEQARRRLRKLSAPRAAQRLASTPTGMLVRSTQPRVPPSIATLAAAGRFRPST